MATLKLNSYGLFFQSSTNRPEFGLGNNFPVISEQSSFTATFNYFKEQYGTFSSVNKTWPEEPA